MVEYAKQEEPQIKKQKDDAGTEKHTEFFVENKGESDVLSYLIDTAFKRAILIAQLLA